MRRLALAALLALAVYFVLIALGAVVVTSGTATVDSRTTAWVLVNLACGLVAGFAGARAAAGAALPARYAAALAGPGLLALVFALTTGARDDVRALARVRGERRRRRRRSRAARRGGGRQPR